MDLLPQIRLFLQQHRLSATQFGRDAVRDGRLVHDMRRGRQLRPGTEARVRAFMEARR